MQQLIVQLFLRLRFLLRQTRYEKRGEYEVMQQSIRNGHRSQAGHRTIKINVSRQSINWDLSLPKALPLSIDINSISPSWNNRVQEKASINSIHYHLSFRIIALLLLCNWKDTASFVDVRDRRLVDSEYLFSWPRKSRNFASIIEPGLNHAKRIRL